ncbi:glycine zipper 2TM domain-containing protein [Paraglaciecola sp. L3A3]|uniref:glycine zipper 2TM domain-containing protein n=1 Tax=Paraglaciecola sp. L3A3 TaxID=2686358 RepID=UPI00131E9A24|nr:glycine zipper 2TM domain-containing protein [Paraglaciecola sp. L3A3]
MKRLIASTIILLLASPLAQANNHKSYHKARVVNVSPVYEYVAVTRNIESCPTISYSKQHNATVIGSVIGGSIAHATSNKRHKVINTIAGAIIGGAIGHKIDHHSKQTAQSYCDTKVHRQTTSKQRVLKGYEVSYVKKGRTYQTFSKNKPNKHIRIYH